MKRSRSFYSLDLIFVSFLDVLYSSNFIIDKTKLVKRLSTEMHRHK